MPGWIGRRRAGYPMDSSELLEHLTKTLEQLGLEYLITGSMATIAFGEPRFTNDIDVVVKLRLDQVEAFCAAFPAPDFYLSPLAARHAIKERGQFNIIHPASGLKVDVIIPEDTALDRSRFSRAVRVKVRPEHEVCFASPEDVIIKKLEFYKLGGSEKHLRDIAGVLKILGDRVDREYISRWADHLQLDPIW